jgi:hypothetical protein
VRLVRLDCLQSVSDRLFGNNVDSIGIACRTAGWIYLTGSAFGLGTIIEMLRFQSVRIREVETPHGYEHHGPQQVGSLSGVAPF